MAISFEVREVLPTDVKVPTSFDEAVEYGYPIVAARALAAMHEPENQAFEAVTAVPTVKHEQDQQQTQIIALGQRKQHLPPSSKNLPNFNDGITEDQIRKLISYAGAYAMINGFKAGLPLDEEAGRIYAAAIDSVSYAIGSKRKTLWDVENQIQIGLSNIKQGRLEKIRNKGSGKLIEVEGPVKVPALDLEQPQRTALYNAFQIESITRGRDLKQDLKNAISSARGEVCSLNDISPKSLTDDKLVVILALAGLIDLSKVPSGRTETLDDQTIKIIATNWKYTRSDCAEKENLPDSVVMSAIKDATKITGARTNNALRIMLVKDGKISAEDVKYIG